MVKKIGINMGGVKVNNRSSILRILHMNGPMSRKDIAQLVNLTPAAVTILTNEMKEETILMETGELAEDKRAGRKKILIDINYNYKYVIGINIESDYINLGIANLKGETITSKSILTDNRIKPEELLENVANECIGMLWKTNILKDDVLGVGVGIVGLVEEERGISKKAYGLWDKEVPVKKILEEALALKVIVNNNVKALAIGQIDYGNDHSHEGLSNMLFIKYGPGIGSAIIINKEIYYGSNNRSGEIGHTIIDSNGKVCRCGKKGCLETLASKNAMIEKVKEEITSENAPFLYAKCKGNIVNIDMADILESASKGDYLTIQIVKETTKFMSIAISNAISLIDPNKVLLYGKTFKDSFFYDEFIKAMQKVYNEKEIEEMLEVSQLTNKSNYIGGAALAIRQFFFQTGGIS